MANVDPSKASSSRQDSKEGPENTVEIHIKTLDSQIYTFCVENNIRISLLKEKVASTVGVPTGQQRLIFRGRVLKDDQTLSDYHVEDGHTLHLVARQPVQSQTGTGTNSDQASSRNGNGGNDAGDGTQRARIGHSVLVGLNVTDQGEGAVADISRIVGAVLNSIGIGIGNNILNGNHAQVSPGVENGGQNANGGAQTGNQPQHSLSGTLLQQMVIPDSLTTISAYITRMEQTLSLLTGNTPTSQAVNQENRSSSPGFPNLGGLITVLGQAQQLLSGPGTAALLHLSGRLEREGSSSELSVRGQIQAEALRIGVAIQHLGSLLLELGRTVSTLRMGEPPVEPIVNSGPAIYINASGPNPLMVQPNSPQPFPIFGIPSLVPMNVGIPEPLVLADTPRNISIHVQAGDVRRGQAANMPTTSTGSQVESGQARVLPSATVVAAIPARSRPAAAGSQGTGVVHSVLRQAIGSVPQRAIINVEGLGLVGPTLQVSSNSSGGNPDNGASQSLSSTNAAPGSDVVNTSSSATVFGHVDQHLSAHAQSIVGETKVLDNSSSEAVDSSTSGVAEQNKHADGFSSSGVAKENFPGEKVPTSSSLNDESNSDRNSKLPIANDSMHASGSIITNDSGEPIPVGLGLGGLQRMKRSKKVPSQPKNANASSDVENQALIAKGQEVLQSLVSQSPNQNLDKDVGRRHATQGTTQRVDRSSNLGSVFSGMLQQMMPAVSQILGTSQPILSSPSTAALGSQRNSRGGMLNTTANQVDLQSVVERISQQDYAVNIFHAVLEAAGRLCGEQDPSNSIELLGNDEELANEFVEMLQRHLHQRLQSGPGSSS